MAYIRTWDATNEASPGATDLVSGGDDAIRNLKTDIRERIAKDHYMDIAGTDADHGEHQKITFQSQIAKPAAVANKGFLYIKDVSGKAELHWEDEDGHELALTSAGAIAGFTTAAAALAAALAAVYPVGCIYTTTVATNPGTVFGFGTWAAFGAGRVLVGLDATQTEFDTAEETGGEKTHLLLDEESGQPGITIPTAATATRDEMYGGGVSAGHIKTAGDGGGAHSDLTIAAADAASAHNNLQPYIVVYFWKRTA